VLSGYSARCGQYLHRAGGRLPNLRRIRHDRGRRCKRVDRTRTGRIGIPDRHPSRWRPKYFDLLRYRSCPPTRLGDSLTTNQQAYDAARAIIPGGANSPVHDFGSVGGSPAAMVKDAGTDLTVVEDDIYVYLVGAWGPMLLGHDHPAVVDVVHDAVDEGLFYGPSTRRECQLAYLIANI